MNIHPMNPETSAKLLAINKLLTQSLELQEVLQNVTAAASELISVPHTFIIYLYDESVDKLRLAEGKGINKEALQKVSFLPGESIAGKVYRDKEPKLFKSEPEIDSYMENMSEKNYQYYYEGVYKRKIKSTFCVPILNNNRCLGVLVVNNFEENGIFTKADMQVIRVVADQSAIAIDNSNVYQSLKEKNHLLNQSVLIHKQFHQLIVEGAGIEEIVSLLQSIIGSKVVHHPTNIYEEDENVFPIVRGKEVLGILELEKSFASFEEIEQAAIEHASLTIALELIKDNALLEKELQFREEIFNQLIEGISSYDLKRLVHYFDWDEDEQVQCIIVEGKQEPIWQQNKLKDKEWFIRSIDTILTAMSGKCLVFPHAFRLIIVISTGRENSAWDVIKRIEAEWKSKKQLQYGIGRETVIYHLSNSYKEAIRALNYAKSAKETNVAEYAELGFERLLHEVDTSTIDVFIQDKLGNLLAADPNFIETLQTFIENNKNHKETAASLHIHGNTLYYRLKKAEELLQIDLTNEKNWLDLEIAIRLFVASNKF